MFLLSGITSVAITSSVEKHAPVKKLFVKRLRILRKKLSMTKEPIRKVKLLWAEREKMRSRVWEKQISIEKRVNSGMNRLYTDKRSGQVTTTTSNKLLTDA